MGIAVAALVCVAVGVFVEVGTLAVCVAKMFCAIFVSVAWVSGVGGAGVGVAPGVQLATAKRKTNMAINTNPSLIVLSPLKDCGIQLLGYCEHVALSDYTLKTWERNIADCHFF